MQITACILVVYFGITLVHFTGQNVEKKDFFNALKGTGYMSTEEFCGALETSTDIIQNVFTISFFERFIDVKYTVVEPSNISYQNNVYKYDGKYNYYSLYSVDEKKEYDCFKNDILSTISKSDVPMDYLVNRANYDLCATNGFYMRGIELENLPGLWIRKYGGEITVYNRTGYQIPERIKNMKSNDSSILISYVVGINKEVLKKKMGEWNQICTTIQMKTVGLLIGLFVLILTGVAKIVWKIKVLNFEEIKADAYLVAKYIRIQIFGLITGERWTKKGFIYAETMRNRCTFGTIGVCICAILYGVYHLKRHRVLSFGQSNLYYMVWALILVLTIVLHIRGSKKIIEDYKQLEEGVDQIYQGDFSAKSFQPSQVFYTECDKLGHIGMGLEKSLEQKIQAERTKIELVTNVSHDLKTPLTSIISYIDLLQRLDNMPLQAEEYIQILEEKADKLKAIVSDVFELAKTASGEIKIENSEINANKLLEQTVASLEDRINASGLTIRLKLAEPPAYIYSDGQRLYRVLQNLIDNALKYSMKGTRIYIIEKRVDENIEIAIKNTANYEMDFSEEEVLERFFCGDKSRNTEGHGLGLSIAQGFTVACGGTFRVRIDGDQFNVYLSFPIVENPVLADEIEEEQ